MILTIVKVIIMEGAWTVVITYLFYSIPISTILTIVKVIIMEGTWTVVITYLFHDPFINLYWYFSVF